jgi:hypothetical protein
MQHQEKHPGRVIWRAGILLLKARRKRCAAHQVEAMNMCSSTSTGSLKAKDMEQKAVINKPHSEGVPSFKSRKRAGECQFIPDLIFR